MENSPCYKDGKDCPRRTSTCHGDCPEYKIFYDNRIAENEAIWKKKNEEAVYTDTRVRALNKAAGIKSKQSAWRG